MKCERLQSSHLSDVIKVPLKTCMLGCNKAFRFFRLDLKRTWSCSPSSAFSGYYHFLEKSLIVKLIRAPEVRSEVSWFQALGWPIWLARVAEVQVNPYSYLVTKFPILKWKDHDRILLLGALYPCPVTTQFNSKLIKNTSPPLNGPTSVP